MAVLVVVEDLPEAEALVGLTPNQRRTLKARQALARKLGSREERSEYFRRIAKQKASGNTLVPVVLTRREVDTLGGILAKILEQDPLLEDA